MKRVVMVASVLALAAVAAEEKPLLSPARIGFSPDGKRLAVVGQVGDKQALELWDLAPRRPLWRLPLDAASRGVVWPDDRTMLVTAGPAVVVVDASAGKVVRTLEPHGKTLAALALSPDGKTLATASDERTLHLRDWKADRVLVRCEGDAGVVSKVSFSPDGKRLLAANGKSAVLWDAATGKRVREFSPNSFHLATVAFQGDEVVTGGYDGSIFRWGAGGEKPRTRFGGIGGVRDLALHDGRHLLAAWGHGKLIAVYDITPRPQDPATAARIKALLEQLDDDRYETREAASRDLRALGYAAEPALARAVETSPSAEVRIRARVLHQALHNEPRQLKGHTGNIRDVAFSRDGKRLASCSDDGTVRLWDPVSGKELERLP